jgi:hypothetical protein
MFHPQRAIARGLAIEEQLARLRRIARWLFLRIRVRTDDAGRLKGAPDAVRATVLLLERAATLDEVDRELHALEDHGLILRYWVDEESYIEVLAKDAQ